MLKEDVEVLKGDVRVLKDDVEVLKGDVRELKENVGQLEHTTSEHTDAIRELRQDFGNVISFVKRKTGRNDLDA